MREAGDIDISRWRDANAPEWHPVPRPGSFPGCRHKRRVQLSDLQMKSRLDFSMYVDEDGGFWKACGNRCDACLRNKSRMWQGRIIGESVGAEACYFVTLTIGGDRYVNRLGLLNERAVRHHREDVERYFKRMKKYQHYDWLVTVRAEGLDPTKLVPPSMRYFAVSELGTDTFRCHYHFCLFVTGGWLPAGIPMGMDFFHGKMDEMLNISDYPEMLRVPGDREYWSFGFSNWKPFTSGHAGYVSDYISKDVAAAHGNSLVKAMNPAISRHPLFGCFYFDLWAKDHIEQGVPLASALYRVPRAPFYEGRRRQFLMPKSVQKYTILSYRDQFDDVHPNDDPPESTFVRRFFEAGEDRKLGTPQLAMLRSSYLMYANEKLANYQRRQRLTLEELADSDVVQGQSRQLLKGMLAYPRTDERIAVMGNRR